jgi:hypothetical protein
MLWQYVDPARPRPDPVDRVIEEQVDHVAAGQLMRMCRSVQLLWSVPSEGEAGPVTRAVGLR